MLHYARFVRAAAGGPTGLAVVSSLGISFNTSLGNKSVTATPTVNDLIVVVAACSAEAIGSMSVSDNQGGTYTLVASAAKSSSLDALGIWVRTALVSSAVSTIYTLTTDSTDTGGGLAVLAVSNMAKTGATAVRQSAKQDNQAASGTPAPAFASSVLSGNAVLGAIFNATNPATMTPPGSYTELQDVGYITPTAGLEVASRNTGETGTTITWGGTSASAFCSIVAELDTSP